MEQIIILAGGLALAAIPIGAILKRIASIINEIATALFGFAMILIVVALIIALFI